MKVFYFVFMINSINLAAAQDLLIADFESETYGGWQVTGDAFGPGPAQGTLPAQMHVSGFQGGRLVNTFYNGDETTGALTSPPFRIEHSYINFLIGGGGYPGWTCMDLIISDKTVRTATGPNIAPGGSEQLSLQTWDVSGFVGQTAQIRIIDRHIGGWGHINVDHIVQSDKGGPAIADKTRAFLFQKQYLNLPVKNGAPRRLLRLYTDDKCVHEFNIELAPMAPNEPDYWVFLDVSEFRNQTGTLHIYQYNNECKAGFDAIFQADTFPGQENLYREKLRPQFHFTSRRGWINDTNGMVWYDGEYHMFYQHSPYSWHSSDKAWGHAVSTDMIHWRELPAALHPDELGPIWSGSAVIDHNNTSGFQSGPEKPMVCFYTSAGGWTPWSLGRSFTQSLAYSNDRGRMFTKYLNNPIIHHISGSNRDPKVFWHEPTKQWVMVLFWEDHMMGFFTSPDLKLWTRQSEIKSFHECPELFDLPVDGDPANTKWVLYGASGDYMLGQFDGKRFVPDGDPLRFHYGNCFYASQTFNNIPASDGRRIQMAWGTVDMPGMPFNQMILFPVSLTLHTTEEGIRMYAQPVKEIESLHQKQWRRENLALRPGVNPLVEIRGELFHIKAALDISETQSFQLTIRDIPITYDAVEQQITCCDKTSPLSPADGMILLEILVDCTTIEIFANGGCVYMPIGVLLPDNPQTINLSAEGRLIIMEIEVNELKSIWR